MANPEDSESRGFKVQDRRRFTAEGDVKPEVPSEPDAPTPAGEQAIHLGSSEPPAGATEARRTEPPPESDTAHPQPPLEINFSTFLISLGTQALAYLGEIPSPADGSRNVDLAAAKEMIDIISMLKEKTTANLEPGEQGLLDNLLYDLRLRYVERVRNQPGRG